MNEELQLSFDQPIEIRSWDDIRKESKSETLADGISIDPLEKIMERLLPKVVADEGRPR